MAEKQEMRFIVRIANKDLDGKTPIYRALTGIKGISTRMSRMMALAFEKDHKVAFDTPIGHMPENLDAELEKVVMNPQAVGIPDWAVNRQKDRDSGKTWHAVMADLALENRKDLQRLSMIKSYRGLRHVWKLTVRGQKTKSTHRGKGGVVGVKKKENKK